MKRLTLTPFERAASSLREAVGAKLPENNPLIKALHRDAEAGLITDTDAWFSYLLARNETSHILRNLRDRL